MSTQISTPRYWIFKDFPDNVWFRDYPDEKVNGWVVEPDSNIRAGDVAYLWREEDQHYFLGWAEISVDPGEQVQNPFTGATVESHWMAQFNYHSFDSRPLLSDYLRDEHALERLVDLRNIQQNVIEITPQEAAALNRLIRAQNYETEAPPDPPEELLREPEQKKSAPVDPESLSTMTLEQLFKNYSVPERRFSKLARTILEHARELAVKRGLGDRLTSSCILFAITEPGAGEIVPQTTNASEFLRSWINESFQGGYNKELADFLKPRGTGPSHAQTLLSSNAMRVVETAWRIANFVRKEEVTFVRKGAGSSERGKVYARDLVGALIYEAAREPKLGAARRLKAMRATLEGLREDYLEHFLSGENNPDDDLNKWRAILIDLQPLAEPPSRVVRVRKTALPPIAADTPSLKDDLDITAEVKGFANIIAARDVKTPLSIGLFGDWGSGKSTFMEQLQVAVEEISARVRAKKDEEETSFYGNIVQIKFNAWHYAEANLWASLVSHVFENLSFSEKEAKEKAEERKQLILGQLVTNLATQRVAEAEVRTKEANYERARTALDGAQRKVDDARFELRDVLLEGIWPIVTRFLGKNPDAQQQLDQARSLLGRTAATEEELKREIDASRSTMGRLQLRLASLAADPRLAWKLALLLALTIVVPVALSFLVAQLSNTEILQRVVAGVTPLITVIGGAIAWWRSKRKSVTTMLDTLDDAGKQLDQMYARARGEYESKRDRLDREVDERKAEIETARQEVEKANNERTETLAALRQMEPARQLETFVQERAASEDYRKLLGVVALIRRDFKRLSDMLREQDNDELRQAVTKILEEDAKQRADESRAAKAAKNGGSAAATNENDEANDVVEVKQSEVDERMKEYRVDRIVLYIDDLDRCPPKQVVDVLQAIHLLLAFELFVVVVGVDARWIGHALRKQFPEMLNEDWEERNGNGDGDRHLTNTATPRDYVEKIFQVPFWLKPLDDDGSRKLLEGLIPDSQLLPVSGTGHVAAANQIKNDGHRDAPPLPQETPSIVPPSSAAEKDTSTPAQKSAKESTTGELHVNTESLKAKSGEPFHPQKPDLVLKPESLLLDVKEREEMIALSRVIGRTPRTLKRFVNIYRIIKAGLNDHQLDAFIGTSPAEAQYRAVLLLLSVAHGVPDLAPNFFRELMRPDLKTPDGQPITGLRALLSEISTRQSVRHQSLHESWLELMEELVEVMGKDKDKDDIPLTVLREWLPVVVRYTFQLGRLSEEVDSETSNRESREK